MSQPATSQRLEFPGHSGAALAARLDLPGGDVRAYALFAHCFTCSKDLIAVRRIAAELTRVGIAVLRFDFTGLGASEGEFASTNFSSNVGDLVSAVDYLRAHYAAPALLIGHSLGGAAVLAAAASVPEARAVVTIAAPADAAHVIKNFGANVAAIEKNGEAEVQLAGRAFRIQKQLLDDVRAQRITEAVSKLRKALLVMHAPLDKTVDIENATRIFVAAKHPKSFISLDSANHLLSNPADADYAAHIIAAWVTRYLPAETPADATSATGVRVTETGAGRYQNVVQAGPWRLFADEPESVGGLGSGPSPYDFVAMGLAACTAMTLRMYAEHKNMALGRISVDVSHAKVHAQDCADCTQGAGGGASRIDRFERTISVDGTVPPELADKLVEIAGKCPVHRTLEHGAAVVTHYTPSEP